MPVGQVDPARRDRIIEAATACVAEDGVAGTSHRRVAGRAGVPLGSMTYHFTGMEHLLREVFERFARAQSAVFAERLRAATDLDQAREAVADLIHHDLGSSVRDLVLTHELYTLAAREPAFRTITRDWMARSRAVLERHVDPDTARQLDALIEGLWVHRSLDTDPHARRLTLDAVTRITTPQGSVEAGPHVERR